MIDGKGWLVILASVVVAFAALIALPLPTVPWNVIPPLVFTGLPLLVLGLVSNGHHTALFRKVGFKHAALAVGFGLLSIITSFAAAFLLSKFAQMSANPAASTVFQAGALDLAFFFIRTFIQLIGEELLTILPLLAILWLAVSRLKMSRRMGLTLAVVGSTLIFGAVHLPTYNWNVVQCFGVIGTARLVLTAAFLVTRNLWVSAGAHIINDWTEFMIPVLLGGHGPIDTAA